MQKIRSFLKNSKGATAIEYALIASIISIAGIAAFLALGAQSKAQFEQVHTAYEGAN